MSSLEQEYLSELKNLSKDTEKKPDIKWHIKSLAEIMETEYMPIKWVVNGFIPEGLTLISGSPKVGKSWLALHLAQAVSNGGCFMGKIPVDQREVLYLALEDSEQRIKSRVLKQGGTSNDKLLIATSWRGKVNQLKKYIDDFPSTGLIIIDTLFKFSPVDDTNEYSMSYKTMTAIQELSINSSIPIVLIHHTKKGANYNEGVSWADQSMGSTGFTGGCDTTILLTKKDGKNEGKLYAKGRDIEERAYSITFDRDICSWSLIGETDIVTETKTHEQTEILNILEGAKEGFLTTGDIAGMMGKSEQATSNLLNRMLGNGKIKKPSYGKWTI